VNALVLMLQGIPFDTTSQEHEQQCEVVIAPSSLHWDMIGRAMPSSSMISLCAQNISASECGAFTGEIAASQVHDFGLKWTLTGHSERRTLFQESDEIVAKKTAMALQHGLKVIACIGETLQEREANETLQVLQRQMQALLDYMPSIESWSNVVIAYEPVWAIGTGKVATPEQAQEAHQQLRAWVAKCVSPNVAEKLRIIYGGSVKASNCEELIHLPDVDGFLVGGASLKSEFVTIVASAQS